MSEPTISLAQCLESVSASMESADIFYGHGTDNAWDESVYLVFTALGVSFDADEAELARELSQAEIQLIEILLARRIQERIPVAYLVGEAWFAGIPFKVDERALIPRSPIAELIQQEFATLIPRSPNTILDLCTGSGCIGIATALAFPQARVDLADISLPALALAEVNLQRYQLQSRVTCVASDLFQNLSTHYDLILSNPPYVSQEEVAELPDEYHKEPELGLICDDNGLSIPLRILREAPGYLTVDGILIMEVGYSRAALTDRLPDVPLLWLEFAHGGDGVLLISRNQLLEYSNHFGA